MAGDAKASDALLERRRNVGQEIFELPVVQLTLSQRTISVESLRARYSHWAPGTSRRSTELAVSCCDSCQFSGPNSASRLEFRSDSRSIGSSALGAAPSIVQSASLNSPK